MPYDLLLRDLSCFPIQQEKAKSESKPPLKTASRACQSCVAAWLSEFAAVC